MAMLLAVSFASALTIGGPAIRNSRVSPICMGLHDLSAKTMDGSDLELKTLAGKKVIALNVASK